MIIRFKGHNHTTQFKLAVRSRLSKWFGSYKWPVCTWFGHGDGCCNYWLPMDTPEGRRALMLDDNLGLSQRLNQTGADDE